MTYQLLIYETAVPVSNGRHAKCSVEVRTTVSAATSTRSPSWPRSSHWPPRNTPSSLPGTQRGHAGGDPGAHDKENLYLSEEGDWRAEYIPAFLPLYPFVFSVGEDPKT